MCLDSSNRKKRKGNMIVKKILKGVTPPGDFLGGEDKAGIPKSS
jgi:hypothetical protein